MVVQDGVFADLETPTGPMRTHIVRPAAEGRYPGILLYSEIFQVTAPVRRMAIQLAGHGYTVAVPEVYHEYEAAGRVLAYDQAGSDRGNELKYTKPVAAYDADARAVLQHLLSREDASGKVGVMGICLGGHLAFRAAMNPEVRGTVCFYATDLAKGTLGSGRSDDSLARAGEIRGELLMAWGRQDPHIPTEDRVAILNRLNEAGVKLNWHEVNGAHAFLRDEGVRYDPELARLAFGLALDLFQRTIAIG
jgi:carboxymethylenebutenolidase